MDENEIKRLIGNVLRKGTISAVDANAEPPAIRVKSGELESNWVQWFALAGKSSEWDCPVLGEQVMLFSPSGEPTDAVALRGIYCDDFPAPSNIPTVHVLRRFADGALIQYDHETHTLDAELPEGGTVNVTAPSAVVINTEAALIKCETFDVETSQGTIHGPLTVKGPLVFESGMTGKAGAGGGKTMQIDGSADFTGEVKSQGISLPGHTHREQGDGNDVGPAK